MWLTSIEENMIESVPMDHLVRNNIKIEDVNDVLLESMSELVKEKLIEQPIDVEDSENDGDDMESMLEKCNDAQRALSECIEEMRVCIDSANKVYRYCLSWLAIAVKHKSKIDVLEVELCSLGKSFDFMSDKDGEK